MRFLAIALVVIACGGGGKRAKTSKPDPLPEPKTITDKIVHLLPHGAQIVVEIDLARLRGNAVIGETLTKALAAPMNMPSDLPTPPLAAADAVVFASYGIGTSNAATIAVIATTKDVPDATRISTGADIGIWAMGPSEWVRQLEARAALSLGKTPVIAPPELLRLRERSMPEKAPGASLRVTARLPFDARVALAKDSGLESAPAQISIWADVVDDFVIVIDADAVDPGEKATKKSTARLEKLIRHALRSVAEEPKMRALGLSSSISRARLAAGGSWIRTIIAVGPAHLRRVIERANTFLAGGSS
ncbi:MAG: hypothetical protein M4D80_30415 [Myxococcota bacterium]|nr:hypothetical protein [Deltaproteobacteria bacterium]MDQ3339500.1 hypothetical protein [Myxococcota bacterium]